MKISMSMIEQYLSRYDIESDIQDDALTIRGVRFLSGERQRSSREYVYLGQALDYLEDPRYADALILANGKNHIVCRGSDYEELLNDVLSAFEFYNSIEETLIRAAAEHEPLSKMIDAVGKALEDALLVFGIDGAFLGAANLDRLPSQELRASIDEHGSLGAQIIGSYFVDAMGVPQHDLRDEAHTSYSPENESAVSRYFSLENERVGFVMCFPLSEASARFSTCLENAYASHFALAAEFTGPSSPHQSQRLALKSLVEGTDVSDAAVTKIQDTLGTEDGFYLVLVQSLAIRNRTQRLLLAEEVELSEVPCLSCEFDETVTFLVAQPHLEALIAQIQQRFDERSASIGVSMPMTNMRQAPQAYRQASFACGSSSEAGVRYCRDLALPFFVQVLRSEPATLDLLHPALQRLFAYDAETKSELLPTLKAYVEAGCNQMECARTIHIHINTLKYRLKRITELTGLDFKNQDELLYLKLSLALHS